MATRRPADPPRSPDAPKEMGKGMKEIPKVIRADEKGAVKAPKAPAASPVQTAAPGVRPRAPSPPLRATREAAARGSSGMVSEDVRRGMIAEGAYLRAERRGFAPGHEEEDWLAAEAEVDRLLKARHGGTAQ
jgi:hypothetical protein